MGDNSNAPIIIIGAGLVGLTVAQGLKKDGFSFEIFDRDTSLEERPAGWGITMHWALPALASCLPPELFAMIPSIQVNPIDGGKENDCYRFLNLETGQDQFNFPSSTHYRLNRKKFRDLLSIGINVNWGRRFTHFETTDDGVLVHFADGSNIKGSMLLAVDGKNSRVKRLLIGEEKAKLNPLPVAFIGISLRLSAEKVQPFREIHPILWQGTHPGSGYYIFFSMLSTPESNGTVGTENEYYEGQFNMSWLVEKNGRLPVLPADQIAKMKAAAVCDTQFFSSLQQAVLDIPDDSSVLEIKLEDWPTQTWPSMGGKVQLLGDAAHTMTMYRGEAANHGIYDAARLKDQLVQWRDGYKSLQQVSDAYQAEVQARTHDAVLMSRQACLDAHELDALRQDSPIFQVSGFNALATQPRVHP
ncbi:hypothetical protein BDW59DRAFT_173586 [Aspergillus cavernicola]|uniref:FAD-binding domain-containing protein n=1 Tax=Aspergillus cavernicola TaxID=176166 RepID=A0ABR4I6J3_9EURO